MGLLKLVEQGQHLGVTGVLFEFSDQPAHRGFLLPHGLQVLVAHPRLLAAQQDVLPLLHLPAQPHFGAVRFLDLFHLQVDNPVIAVANALQLQEQENQQGKGEHAPEGDDGIKASSQAEGFHGESSSCTCACSRSPCVVVA